MVLLLRRARTIFAADHTRLAKALRTASDKYADTVMLGLDSAAACASGDVRAEDRGVVRSTAAQLDASGSSLR